MLVAQKVAVGVFKGVTTSELDELAAETAASMTSKHPDYAQVRPAARPRAAPIFPRVRLSGTPPLVYVKPTSRFLSTCEAPAMPLADQALPPCFSQLAARIAVSNLHKNTTKSFSET